MESLQLIWFVLIAVLWTGYFLLEGFDFGVGILAPLIARDDVDRRVAINTIGPVWDGNEVWLLTAGGATFAAFPFWYATLFPAFYLALLLILVALIVRGVGFEYRHKVDDQRWRDAWTWTIFFGSVVPALLWGVAWANIIQGIPITEMQFTGNFFNLIDPYALLGGVFSLALFTLHGALYLALKTTDELSRRAFAVAKRLDWIVVGLYLIMLAWSYLIVPLGDTPVALVAILAGIPLVLLVAATRMTSKEQPMIAFGLTSGAIVVTVATIFATLYPRVMVSSTSAGEDLTIAAAAASDTTLTLMTIAAAIFTPIVLLYTGWTYWVFRHRVTRESITGPTETPIDVLAEKFGGTSNATS